MIQLGNAKMMRTRRKIRNATGKSKKIKLSGKAKVPQVNNSDTESDKGPDEEEEIILAVQDNNEDDPLNLHTPGENGPSGADVDHNNTDKQAKQAKKHRIMLRQDLFPSPIKTRSNNDQASSNQRASKSQLRKKNASVQSKTNLEGRLRKMSPPPLVVPKTSAFDIKTNKDLPVIPGINMIERDNSVMYVHEDLDDVITPSTLLKSTTSSNAVCENDTTSNSSKDKATPKDIATKTRIYKNKRKSNIAKLDTIIIDDEDSPAKHLPTSKQPIILKKVRPKEVPEQIKKGKLLRTPALIPKKSIQKPKGQYILPRILSISGPKKDSSVSQTNPEICKSVTNTQQNKTNETIIIDDDEFPSKQPVILMKVNANEVPEEIKKSKVLKTPPLVLLAPAFSSAVSTIETPIIQGVPVLSQNIDKNTTPIILNGKTGMTPSMDLTKGDTFVMDVRNITSKNGINISDTMSTEPSVAQVIPLTLEKTIQENNSVNQQTSKTGSTIPKISVVNEDDSFILPSTSSISNNAPPPPKNSQTQWAHLDPESSSDDEASEGELGLNSIEELKDLWELIQELYYYNNQTIKSLVTKQKRFNVRIKAVENLLEEALGTKENGESSTLATAPTETDGIQTEEKSKEE